LWFILFASSDSVACQQHNTTNQLARPNASCHQCPNAASITTRFEGGAFSFASSTRFDRDGGEGPMEDTLSNQDLDASHTIIGTDSKATAASSPRRDFRAVAACGGLASLAAVVIGAGILIRPPTASAVPSFARQTGQPCATCHTAFPELTPFGRRFKLSG